ncbi:MAG TPA: hypothetical protein VGG46_11460 [Terriglobales bacterium]|jgi:hypothetical protein
MTAKERYWRFASAEHFVLFLLLFVAAQSLSAQQREDFDAHTFRIDGLWFYSKPTGSFHGSGSQGRFDLQGDVDFNFYNTGALRLEWKFTRKNHLYLGFLPLNQSKQTVLTRTVAFQGQTFDAGLAAKGELDSYLFTPGYQYDIIRRKRGHFGIATQIDLFYIKGSLKAADQIANGVPHFAQTSSSTLRAPLPVAGPDFRYYLTNSNHLFVAGNLLGMYFFGYGNFISSCGTLGVALNKHLNLQGGYQLSSRLNIQSKTDRIGLDLTQRGVVAGLEVSF